MHTEAQANQALEAASRVTYAPRIGSHFATPGPVRTYRKPSLISRFLRAFA